MTSSVTLKDSLVNISNQLNNIYVQELDSILKDISEKYNLDYFELKNKYIENKEKQVKVQSEPKKRGRKKKIKEEYVEMEEYIYNDLTYLIDSKNIVYTNDIEAPRIIGEKLVDGNIKFYKNEN